MRKFDVDAIALGVTQYWSSLNYTANVINPQVAGSGVSGIVFEHAPRYIESFDNLDNWYVTTPTRFELDTTTSYGRGDTSLKLLSVPSGGAGLSIKDMAVEPGQVYQFTYDVMKDAAYNGTASNSKIRIAVSGTGAFLNAFGFADTSFAQADVWESRVNNYTVPAGIYSIDIQISNDNTAGNMWLDNLRIQRIDGTNLISPVLNNRNISRGSPYSIAVTANQGVVTSALPVDDFTLSLLMQPDTSDLWLFRIELPEYDIGVKINVDTSIELIWPEVIEAVDDDGNTTTTTELQKQSLIYSEDSSFISITRVGTTASMSLNGKVVTIDGPLFSFTKFYFGGGSGSALIDKIAFSTAGVQVRIPQYINLFSNQRLDVVPRPKGDSTFSYLLDGSVSDVRVYDRSDFTQMEDYQYLNYFNPFDSGVLKVDKRASLIAEYSVDQGLTWTSLPTKLKLSTYCPNLIIRHNDATDQAFYIQVVNTNYVNIPLSFFNASVSGPVYLPSEIGYGYYDADPGDFTSASVVVTGVDSPDIRSIEFLGTVNDITNVIKDNVSSTIKLINPGFEDDFNGWYCSNASTVTIETVNPHSGTKCVKTVGSGEVRKDDPSQMAVTVPGDQWKMTGWFRNESFVGPGGLRLQRRVESTGLWVDLSSSSPTAVDNTWTLSTTATATVPADSNAVRARVAFAGTGSIYYDDLEVVRVTSKSESRPENRLYDIYINGQPRELSTLKNDQMYHVIIVWDVPVQSVTLAATELVGIGASNVAYTQSEAYYIFNTFAGNPLVTSLDIVDSLTDGISDSGQPSSLLDLQWNK